MGTKRSVLTDKNGLPLSVVLGGANRHFLEATLDAMVAVRPAPTEERPQNICLDAAYVGSEELFMKRGYVIPIRPHGEEKKEPERNPDFEARPWVMEGAHSFMNRFRKLLVRYEKKADSRPSVLTYHYSNSRKTCK